MRYPSSHKSETRSLLLQSAARQVRSKGTESIRLADATEAAGLTNGGFYKHFTGKDQLVREAIGAGLAEVADRFAASSVGLPRNVALRNVIEVYLSEEHVKHPDRGCPLAAVGTEIARLPLSSRRFVSKALDLYASRLLDLMPGDTRSSRRSAFYVLFSSMAGCVMSARVDPDQKRRKDILSAARSFFIRLYCEPPSGSDHRKGR